MSAPFHPLYSKSTGEEKQSAGEQAKSRARKKNRQREIERNEDEIRVFNGIKLRLNHELEQLNALYMCYFKRRQRARSELSVSGALALAHSLDCTMLPNAIEFAPQWIRRALSILLSIEKFFLSSERNDYRVIDKPHHRLLWAQKRKNLN